MELLLEGFELGFGHRDLSVYAFGGHIGSAQNSKFIPLLEQGVAEFNRV